MGGEHLTGVGRSQQEGFPQPGPGCPDALPGVCPSVSAACLPCPSSSLGESGEKLLASGVTVSVTGPGRPAGRTGPRVQQGELRAETRVPPLGREAAGHLGRAGCGLDAECNEEESPGFALELSE